MPAQLQAHAGQVRCGRCMHAFDGFQRLAVEQPEAVSEVRLAPEGALGSAAASGPDAATAATSMGGTASGDTPAAETHSAAAADASPANPAADPLALQPERLPEHPREIAAAHAGPLNQKYLRRPTPPAGRIATCLMLVVVLAAQVAYAFRSELAARYPVMKNGLSGVCDLAGCSVSLPQRPDLVKIEASDVHMIDVARPSLIQLTATLRSYASHDLAYPALDLVLTNANEHALARRIFGPAEYLDRTRDPKAGLPPRAEITVALDLDTGDLNAAGFRLDLIAAPAP